MEEEPGCNTAALGVRVVEVVVGRPPEDNSGPLHIRDQQVVAAVAAAGVEVLYYR